MRADFAQAIIEMHATHPNFVFVSGDLGYMALERVKETYRERFINAGVAEQNMISVAAGLAYEGFIPWVYSIAPFAVLRPYEQLRNDVCLHNLPVKVVGNGGGYGYGIMGATHHTLEDIGVMRALPNMKVYVPLISSDVAEAMETMGADPSPNYLRLNSAATLGMPIGRFRQWRRIRGGGKGVVIGAGPVVGNVLAMAEGERDIDLEVWSIGVFPVYELPEEVLTSVRMTRNVMTIEEHGGQSGLNEAIARLLLERAGVPIAYRCAYAKGYPGGTYGSQGWHQAESSLAGAGLRALLREVARA
jgi:transketolase